MNKYTDSTYLDEVEAFSEADKGESYISHYKSKIVITRKKHECLSLIGDVHVIPKGTKAVREEFIHTDFGRGSSHVCLKCIEEYLNDLDLEDELDD